MTPVSIPVNPPFPVLDPNGNPLPNYPAPKLETVQEYDADSYLQAWGVPAPWNPTNPIKTWFDSSVASLSPWTFVQYQTIQEINGNYEMAPFSLPAGIAAIVNIPPGWPKVPAPNPITPVPMRPLKPNEALSPVFGVLNQSIIRTDMPQAGLNQAPAPAPAPGDGFTATDRSMLQGIFTATKAVLPALAIALALLAAPVLRAQAAPAPPVPDALPTQGIALGGAYAPGGSPNVAGWVSQWNKIGTGIYNYNTFDVTSLKQSPFTAQNSARVGVAYFLKSVGPVDIFGLGDAGVATAATSTGTAVGSAFSGGGGAVLPLGSAKKIGLIFCVRVLKTALSNSQNVYELGLAWGK